MVDIFETIIFILTSWYDINFEPFIILFYLTIFCSSHSFLFWITMGKGISRIYKYDQQNWPYPSPNTTFVITEYHDASIKNQRNSVSDSSLRSHEISAAVLDQSTNHHGNTGVNNNDESRSFETPRGNNYSSSFFVDTITTTSTSIPFTLPLSA